VKLHRTVPALFAVALIAWTAMAAVSPARSSAETAVHDEAGLRAAFGDVAETNIVLTDSISLTDCAPGPVVRDSATDLRIDGAGFTITQTCGYVADLWQHGTGAVRVASLTIDGGSVGIVSDAGSIDVSDSSFANIYSNDEDAYGVQAKVGDVVIERSSFQRIGANCCTGPGATGDVAAAFAGATMAVASTTVTEIGSGIPGRATGLLSNGTMTVTSSKVDSVANGGFGPSSGIRSLTGDVTLVDTDVSNIYGLGAPLFGVAADEGQARLIRSRVGDIRVYQGLGVGVSAGNGVTLTDSSIVGISAPVGPVPPGSTATLGVRSSGSAPVVLTRSTVANASGVAGGTAAGILAAGDVLATNSTVTGNDGPGITTPGEVRLVFSDVVDSGGSPPVAYELAPAPQGFGQVVAGMLTTAASVIALPRAGSPNCAVGTSVSAGDNFSDDASCALGAPGDQQSPGVDPQLLGLTDNGGPTPTRIPTTASPLVRGVDPQSCEAAARSGIVTDQRGLPRRTGDRCDIGAVELQALPPVIVQPPRFTG
jgi:hypothetical protein